MKIPVGISRQSPLFRVMFLRLKQNWNAYFPMVFTPWISIVARDTQFENAPKQMVSTTPICLFNAGVRERKVSNVRQIRQYDDLESCAIVVCPISYRLKIRVAGQIEVWHLTTTSKTSGPHDLQALREVHSFKFHVIEHIHAELGNPLHGYNVRMVFLHIFHGVCGT